MIDTHTHLNFEKFSDDVHDVIKRAHKNGVEKFIVPSSNLDTSLKAVKLASKHPEVYAAVGIHPIHAKEGSIEVLQKLYTLLSAPKVVAVGEIGLDYFYLDKMGSHAKYSLPEEQKVILIELLKLAKDAKLPVILHCRQAYREMLKILQGEGREWFGVAHCFMGTVEEARKFLDLGFYISFAGNITYSNALDELIKFVPLERLLVETDSPYLSPLSQRGKRNEPAFMVETVQKIAETKKVEFWEIAEKTTENAKNLFNLSTKE